MGECVYDLWVDYYDIIHTGLPGEAEFYVGQAVRLNAETLELGCGTGRIAIPMAMSGVNVVGLDNSREMLRLCREKKKRIGTTPGTLEIVEADMAGFQLDRSFDLVVIPYRAFMHLLTQESQAGCLACVHKHLRPEGLLMANLWVPQSGHLARHKADGDGMLGFAGRYPLPCEDGFLVHYVAAWCDEERQLFTEEHLIHEVNEKGEVLHSAILPMQRAWVTPEQMRQKLDAQGFAVEAVFGDFDCTPFSTKSTEMIWIARKRAS